MPWPRFIFHRLLRSKDLCPGASQCPEVLMEDPAAGREALPCLECPIQLLNEYLLSPMGRMIVNVLDLDFAIEVRIPVSLGEITYPEFILLRQWNEERSKYRTEEMQKDSQRH